MPFYEYDCKECGASLERLVKMEDRENQVCNSLTLSATLCNAKLTLRVSTTGLPVFKGDTNFSTSAGSQVGALAK